MERNTIVKIDLNNKKYGGRIYENEFVNNLSSDYIFKRVFLMKYKTRILNIPRIICLFIFYKYFFKGNLILTNHTTWMAGNRANNLVIVHHIDTSTSKGLSGIFQKFCDKALIKSLSRFSAVVTVSKYWEDVLRHLGFTNIKVIYNSFDVDLYLFSDKEIFEFKQKYSLQDKPIIYLGNCQKQKGVVEAYSALKELDCNFITSGIKDVDLPAKHLNLNFREYRLLLASSNVVVCMSQLIEGWNRTAHEAMLCRTHVIGSGTGGMRELLEIGGGTVCENITQLHSLVEEKLRAPRPYVRQELKKLDNTYFKKNWKDALDSYAK